MEAEMKPKRVEIQYVEPKNPALRPVYEQIRKADALEKIQTLLAPLLLPRPLRIKTEDCDGVSNAWYEEDAVTICYEFLDDIWKNVPTAATAEIAPVDALLGPLLAQTALRIVLTGAGTSAFIGNCLAPALAAHLQRRVDAVPTTDIVSAPASYLADDVPTLSAR